MADDLQWRVNIEITPANASALRLDNRTAAPLSRTVWIVGTLSLRQGGRLHLVGDRDDRLGGQSAVLRVSARQSVSDGVAGGTERLLYREILFWRQGAMVRVLMWKRQVRELFAAIGYRE
jgi:hypothetical protein